MWPAGRPAQALTFPPCISPEGRRGRHHGIRVWLNGILKQLLQVFGCWHLVDMKRQWGLLLFWGVFLYLFLVVTLQSPLDQHLISYKMDDLFFSVSFSVVIAFPLQ